MEEQIPDDPLECWEHPHFKQAQEHLLSRMREIPLKNRPYLTKLQAILWNEANPQNLEPVLQDLPRSEQEGAMHIHLQMILDSMSAAIREPEEETVNVERKVVRFKLQPLRTKEVFVQLEDKEKAAVLRYVYAQRHEELYKQYTKALRCSTNIGSLAERMEKLQAAYRNRLTSVLGW